MAAKRILRYVKGILEYGILYKSDYEIKLVAFSHSDHAGDHDHRKSSTSGYVFLLGSGVVSWASKQQLLSPYLLQKQSI